MLSRLWRFCTSAIVQRGQLHALILPHPSCLGLHHKVTLWPPSNFFPSYQNTDLASPFLSELLTGLPCPRLLLPHYRLAFYKLIPLLLALSLPKCTDPNPTAQPFRSVLLPFSTVFLAFSSPMSVIATLFPNPFPHLTKVLLFLRH